MLRHLLKRSGWDGDVLEAKTTDEAKARIDAHPDIAAAFIDYYIPPDNGPAVIRSLKEKIPSARIALVSSADSERNAAEARTAGAEAVICTSYRSDEVESAILGLLADWQVSSGTLLFP